MESYHQADVCVRDLDVHFDSLHVLKSVSAHLPANKITAIIGPSGCGKTTLLKCINPADRSDGQDAGVGGELRCGR